MVALIWAFFPALLCLALFLFDESKHPVSMVGFAFFMALTFIGIASLPPKDSMPQTKTTTTTVVGN